MLSICQLSQLCNRFLAECRTTTKGDALLNAKVSNEYKDE